MRNLGIGCGGLVVLIVVLAVIGTFIDDDPTSTANRDATATPGQSGDGSRRVTAEELGDRWPLTVGAGILRCTTNSGGGHRVTFMDSTGTIYALNGIARGSGDLPDIDPIWAASTDGVGNKKNIGPLIDHGLALCD